MIKDGPPNAEKQQTTEIERKFVVHTLPDDLELDSYPSEKIYQGYLANTADSAVRIRRKGNAFFWTYKTSPTGHAAERIELETQITELQFDTMWPGTIGKRLEKTRHKIPYGNHLIELDMFEGDNAGHILAEVEFITTDAADMFEPPPWFARDVTADKAYSNSNIAEHGFPSE